jgi:phosphate transport system permease protein
MRRRPARGRKLADLAVRAAASLAALLGISALVMILAEVAHRGLPALDPAFFTALPGPPGVAGGGLANAILGTLALTFAATLIGVPLGMLAGVYLSEFGRDTRLGAAVRFCVNVLMGLPSILVGLFVWTVLVVPFRGFSGYAGAAALALIMLPVVARTTEDMLSLVPHALREGALAVGTPRWRATLIAFRAARGGLITGVLLAVARVSGETAPLLFTALNSPFWPRSMSEPVSNLTVTIFQYAMSPYADWQAKAWGASLLIMAAVLTTSLLARTFARERVR